MPVEIGSLLRTPLPLVNIPQVKGYLALLHAFAKLKKQVGDLQEAIPHMPTDLEKRWAWFVALAVERFDIWCHGLRASDAQKSLEEILPPIDVLMIWHAYMLNPMWYAEDCKRLPACRGLKAVEIHFSTALNGKFQSILSGPPAQARMDFWLTKMDFPFDHVQSLYKLINKKVYCPRCRTPIVVDMMTVTHEESGYLQKKFSTYCSRGCSTTAITKDTLGLRRIAEYLASDLEFSLAGTFFNPSSPSAPAIGRGIKAQICKSARVSIRSPESPKFDLSCVGIIQYAQYSLSRLKTRILEAQFDSSRRIATRILSAYVDDKPYSVELVGAVLRQGSFLRRVYGLGWTEPHFFVPLTYDLALQSAITQYQAFMDLMASSPTSFFVPTLDIDLVWHTHQLMPAKYKSDCIKHVGRFIDHDDNIKESRLSSAFDKTRRAWKERFNVEYSDYDLSISGDSIGHKFAPLIDPPKPAPPYHPLSQTKWFISTADTRAHYHREWFHTDCSRCNRATSGDSIGYKSAPLVDPPSLAPPSPPPPSRPIIPAVLYFLSKNSDGHGPPSKTRTGRAHKAAVQKPRQSRLKGNGDSGGDGGDGGDAACTSGNACGGGGCGGGGGGCGGG